MVLLFSFRIGPEDCNTELFSLFSLLVGKSKLELSVFFVDKIMSERVDEVYILHTVYTG